MKPSIPSLHVPPIPSVYSSICFASIPLRLWPMSSHSFPMSVFWMTAAGTPPNKLFPGKRTKTRGLAAPPLPMDQPLHLRWASACQREKADNNKSHRLALSRMQLYYMVQLMNSANGGWGEAAIVEQEQARDVSDEVTAGLNWCWQTTIRGAIVASHQLSVTQVFSQWVNHVLENASTYTFEWMTESLMYNDGYHF